MHRIPLQRTPFLTVLLAFAGLLAVLILPAQPAHAIPRHTDLVQADLVAEPAAIVPGEPFWVALRLRMKEHWHTYWQNPGDSGLPVAIKWTLPPGFTAEEIVWPVPSRIAVGPLMNFGFEDEALLLTRITPSKDLKSATTVPLKAAASWLVCEKECVPGEASLSLTLPVAAEGAAAEPGAQNQALFAKARAKLPEAQPGKAEFKVGTDTVTLRIEGLSATAPKSAHFFPIDETLIENAADQTFTHDGSALTLKLGRSALSTTAPDHLAGVLTVTDAQGKARAYRLDMGEPPPAKAATPALATVGSSAQPPAGPSGGSPGEGFTLLGAALFAFLGGIILNLMPCVFPVLSIKVLALAGSGGETPGHMRRHGLAYGAGVLVTFGALAGVLIGVRQAGAEVGWGFQLQSPPVVAALAYVMLAMGLALSGAIHVGSSFAGIGDSLTRKSGLTGSFFTGVLASVVASPCTGPFMGAAIGFALTQSAFVAVVIFLALGAGLAFPFVLLTFFPALLRRMPRPGLWMDRLKQVLAFPLYATVAWLIWVLSQQVDPIGLFAALIGLVMVAFAIWLLNVCAMSRGLGALAMRGLALAVIAALGFALQTVGAQRLGSGAPQALAQGDGIEPFSQRRLDELLAQGKPVFVNMTAAWCITCMVNERTSLAGAEVKQAFADNGITYLKGDWTNQNPEITRVLERHGRGGVPLYLLYSGKGGEPVVLPQVLTQSLVLQELGRAGTRTAARGDAAPTPQVPSSGG